MDPVHWLGRIDVSDLIEKVPGLRLTGHTLRGTHHRYISAPFER